MSYISKKHKFIFKCIALVIIQAFITLDIAWAAGGDIFVPQDKIQAETLAPRLNMDANTFQGIFTKYLDNQKEPEVEITKTDISTRKANRDAGRFFRDAALTLSISAAFLLAFMAPVKTAAQNVPFSSQAPPAIVEKASADLLAQRHAGLSQILDKARLEKSEMLNIREMTPLYADIDTSAQGTLRFKSKAAEERVAVINKAVTTVEFKSLKESIVADGYIDKDRGNSKEAKSIFKALALLKEYCPEAYEALKARNAAIYIDQIEGAGITVGTRFGGSMGRPLVTVSSIFLDEPFWTAYILAHESIHAERIPQNIVQFALKHNLVAFLRNWLFSWEHEEELAFVRETVFAKGTGINPKSADTFITPFDIVSPYYHARWVGLLLDIFGTLLFNFLPVIIASIVISRYFSKRDRGNYLDVRRDFRLGGALSRQTRYSRQSLLNRIFRIIFHSGRGNRLKAILPLSFLAVKLIELLNASSSWAFSDQASSLATGEFGINISLVIAGVLILSGVVRVMLKRFRNGKESGNDIQNILDAEIKKAEKQAEIIKLIDEVSVFDRAGTDAALFKADQLKLKLLNILGVLSEDKITLCPLMGANYLPAQYTPLIGIDMELPEEITDEDIKDLFLSLRGRLGYTQDEFNNKGIVNIPNNILTELDELEKKINQQRGDKQINTLFIKGWLEYLALKDSLATKPQEIYKAGAAQFLKMVNEKFIPEGGFIVLFGRAANFADDLKQLGFVDFLKRELSEEALQKLNQSDNVSEIGVVMGEDIMPRKLILGTKMVVLQKMAVKQVEVGDESAAYKAWQAGKADSTILIDIDGMKLRNRMIGKNNVNMLLDNLVQKVVKTLSETRRFAAYFRNGDENWMVLDGGGNPDYARNIIEKIKIPVENTYFAVGCLEGEGGMDNRTLSVVEKLGGRVDLIGDTERVLIVPGASTNSGNQRLDDFIAKVNEEISNQQKLRGIEDGQITYIKRKVSELDEPGIDNVINFTLSVGFSTGVKDYDEAKIAAARAEEVSKAQSKNGQSGRENIVFDEEVRRSSNRQRSQNVKGLALDDAEAFKEVEINASRKEKEAVRAREEGEILSLDNIAQGVRPEWAPEVIYFHSREAFREYVTVLQQLYPERFRGAFTFTTQYLDYYDTEGKIAAFKKQYEKDASNLVDDRILLGDFKVINSALGQDRGDEAIAVGRVIPMVEAQTMWSDKYDVIFARGGPSTPTAIAIPKPEYADELSQTVPDNTDFQDFAVGVKEKVNEATDVKVGHVGVVYGMFESSNRPIGTIWQQHDKTLTVAESKFVVGRKNETVLTYTTGTDGAWSELTVEDAKAARKDYIRWKRQQAKNRREVLESKRIHEKLMLLKEPSISEEGQEVIRRFSIRQKEDFEEFIAKCQEDLLEVGGKFDEVQMNEFHKFGKHIEKLITKQRQLYPEAKGEDPCYVLNNAAMNIEGGFGDDFIGRFKANYYHKITQPNKNIDWNFHAFIVVRIGDYNFILDLGLMELLGSETGPEDIGMVLIPERIIDKNNTVLWPYVDSTVENIVKSSEFIKWTKLGKKMIEPLLIKKSSTPSFLKIDVLVEQAI